MQHLLEPVQLSPDGDPAEILPPGGLEEIATSPKLSDLPRRVGLEAYEVCREAVRRRVREHPRAIAAYTAGEVRFPGQSDLDVFVVVEDGAPLAPIVSGRDLPEPGPYLANHSFPHYPRSVFREIHYLFPLFSRLEPLVEKEPVEVAPPPDDPAEARLLDAFYAVDYLFKKVFRLLDLDGAAELPVRTLLCHLHTVRYTLALVERVSGEPIGRDYVAEIDRLRGGWFDLDPAEGALRIEALVERALRLGFEAARRLHAFLGPAPDSDFVNRETVLLFRGDGFDPEEAIGLCRQGRLDRALPFTHRRLRVQPVVSPAGLAAVLWTYASGDGPWSEWLRRSLSGNASLPARRSPAIERRTRALDAIATLGLASPVKNSYPYGFPPGGREGLGRRLAARLVEGHARRWARAVAAYGPSPALRR